MELNTPAHTVGELKNLDKDKKLFFMSFLTITYCCEAGKTYVDILENQIKNYQMNKKINN